MKKKILISLLVAGVCVLSSATVAMAILLGRNKDGENSYSSSSVSSSVSSFSEESSVGNASSESISDSVSSTNDSTVSASSEVDSSILESSAEESATSESVSVCNHTYDLQRFDEDGHWLACACGEGLTATQHQLGDWMTDGEAHWRACACGYQAQKAKHTLGEWQSNESGHWKACGECGYRAEDGAHTYGAWEMDSATHWKACSVCGLKKEEGTHGFGTIWEQDENNHWKSCACGQKSEEDEHKFGDWTIGEDTHSKTCACGQTTSAAHAFVKKADETHHWAECLCGKQTERIAHTLGGDNRCAECGRDCSTVGIVYENGVAVGVEENFTGEELIIASSRDGQTITGINSFAFYNLGIKQVILPNTITSIHASAFRNCTGLTEIVIPASVTSIGDHAFQGCTQLTRVIFENPDGWEVSAIVADEYETPTWVALEGEIDLSDEEIAAAYLAGEEPFKEFASLQNCLWRRRVEE